MQTLYNEQSTEKFQKFLLKKNENEERSVLLIVNFSSANTREK